MTSPALATSQDWGRSYLHPRTGEAVPSVTSILKTIRKPALDGWAAKMAAQYAAENWIELGSMSTVEKMIAIREAPVRYTSERAAVGDAVHQVADRWAKGEPSEPPKEIGGYIRSFVNFLLAVRPKFLFTEVTVWSRSAEYAGTADAILEINGEIYLIDYKTSARAYPEHALQVSALAGADFIIEPDGTEVPLPEIHHLGVLSIRPRSWKLYEIGEREDNFSAFLAARELFRWQRETADWVLGEPVARG